jgi:hypothetical protein
MRLPVPVLKAERTIPAFPVFRVWKGIQLGRAAVDANGLRPRSPDVTLCS